MAVSGLVTAVGAASFVAGRRMTNESKAAEPTYTPVTVRPQTIFNARFTPDGQTIVYSAALEGNDPEVFTIGRDYPEPKSLGLRSTHLLSVSSTGELALLIDARPFFMNSFTGTLARMPLGGGAPRELLEHVRDADWMPDGGSLAIVREVGGKNRLEFPVGAVLYETNGYLSDLRISPKGDLIAFIDHPLFGDTSGSVNVVDRSGKKRIRTETYDFAFGLAWARGGDEALFSARIDNLLGIRAVTLSGTTAVRLRSLGEPILADISGVGRWLTVVELTNAGIQMGRTGAANERNLGWLGNSILPFISRDGDMLLFTEQGLGGGHEGAAVSLRKIDGSPVVRLGPGWGYGLSPDGKWAVAVVPDLSRLALYPTGAGEARQFEPGPIRSYFSADWFPDGRRVLGCGYEAGRALRCYVHDIAGDPPRAITGDIGTLSTLIGGLVSPEGTGILAKSIDGRVTLYPVDGGATRPIPGLTAEDEVVGWASDGRSVFIRQGAVPARVERFDLATARRTPFANLAPQDRTGVRAVAMVTIASDDRSYAYSYRRGFSSLYVIDGVK